MCVWQNRWLSSHKLGPQTWWLSFWSPFKPSLQGVSSKKSHSNIASQESASLKLVVVWSVPVVSQQYTRTRSSIGCGSKLNHQDTAGFGPCCHLSGFHFGYLFLAHSQIPKPLWVLCVLCLFVVALCALSGGSSRTCLQVTDIEAGCWPRGGGDMGMGVASGVRRREGRGREGRGSCRWNKFEVQSPKLTS